MLLSSVLYHKCQPVPIHQSYTFKAWLSGMTSKFSRVGPIHSNKLKNLNGLYIPRQWSVILLGEKWLSVPLCTNGVPRKAFHIEASVFLANYCLYPWDSPLRVWSVWTAGFFKWVHDWIQGHWESSCEGAGVSNSHDTIESSLRNTLYPNTPFNSVISTSQEQQQKKWSRASH